MLSKMRNPDVVMSAIAFAALLALPWAFVGCGGDKNKEKTSVRTTNKIQAAPKVALPAPPAVRPTPAPIEAAVVVVPEVKKEVTYDDAEAAYLERRYDEAVAMFTAYTDRRTENPWGHYMLGLSAWKAGDNHAAEAALARAIELDPSHVKSWINLSRVLLDGGHPAQALEKIDEALELDSESGVAYRLRGRAFGQLGETDQAIAAYRRAIQIDNQDAWSMNNLGLLLIESEQFEEALPPLARAVELHNDVAMFQNNLGMALECTGHYRAAEEAYAAAVAIASSYDKAAENLARISDVVEDINVPAVDLAEVARGFVQEIEGWSVTRAEIKLPETIAPATDVLAVSSADSTESGQVQ